MKKSKTIRRNLKSKNSNRKLKSSSKKNRIKKNGGSFYINLTKNPVTYLLNGPTVLREIEDSIEKIYNVKKYEELVAYINRDYIMFSRYQKIIMVEGNVITKDNIFDYSGKTFTLIINLQPPQ